MTSEPDPFAAVPDLTDWLLTCAVTDMAFEQTLTLFGGRLLSVGIPVARVVVSSLVLHPNLGGVSYTWEAATGECRFCFANREEVQAPIQDGNPFRRMMLSEIDDLRSRLSLPGTADGSETLQRLVDEGMTDYYATRQPYYSNSQKFDWVPSSTESTEGTYAAYSTMVPEGFSPQALATLRSLSKPLSVAMKTATNALLTEAVLETYLGRLSAKNILNGTIQRGDGEVIDCALLYSDLRGSTALAAAMPLPDYLATLNAYYAETIGAVQAEGGEVLKLIGDAVLAIFPFSADVSGTDQCKAAMRAAERAISQVAQRPEQNLRAGFALHVGQVMYGNVGAADRLDMTATGPSVNEVARIEGLCKTQGVSLVASEAFKDRARTEFAPLGAFSLPGLSQRLNVYTVPKHSKV